MKNNTESIRDVASVAGVRHGSCLCRAVQFKIVAKEVREVVNCHCRQCRQFHGHYAAYTKVKKCHFQMTGGDHLSWYQDNGAGAKRGFCKVCGSSLFWQPVECDSLCIAAGSLDVPTGLQTISHIYVDELSDYYSLTDHLTCYAGSMYKK